jgi:hypothetical protein
MGAVRILFVQDAGCSLSTAEAEAVRSTDSNEGVLMYATVRRYSGSAGVVKDLAPRIEPEFVPILRQIPGFVSYLVVAGAPENGRDVLVTVSVFRTQEGADESVRKAAAWVAEAAKGADLTAPQITAGQVVASAV